MEGEREGGSEDSCTFNYDQEVFTKGRRRSSSVALVNLAPDAVYCVERLLYTIMVHIRLPLQHLICIIGSLMKLALWNKKYKKKDEKKCVWGGGYTHKPAPPNVCGEIKSFQEVMNRRKRQRVTVCVPGARTSAARLQIG